MSDIANLSEIKETDSDAQIEAMVKEFSASLTSVKQHIDESRKVRTEIEQDVKDTEQTNNETSVWSGDDSLSEKSVKTNHTLDDVHPINTDFEVVNDINDLGEEDDQQSPKRLYWTCYSQGDIVEESIDIDQNVLTNSDIQDEITLDEQPVTAREYLNSTASDITQEALDNTDQPSSESDEPSILHIPKPSGLQYILNLKKNKF